jgi:hypothetical protein
MFRMLRREEGDLSRQAATSIVISAQIILVIVEDKRYRWRRHC